MNMDQLYRQVIMEHYKRPLNKGLVNDSDYTLVHLNNPSCGDEMNVQFLIKDNVIHDIRHEGTGCSICCSSASVMSETLKGKTIESANQILHEFYEMIKGNPFNDLILEGDAIVYQGVSQFPARIKCATLAWKAIEEGIKVKEEG